MSAPCKLRSMGLHTADIIRRDAAEQRIWFTSERMDNKDYLAVTVLYEEQDSTMDLVYAVDMENDLVRDIRFVVRNESKGSLEFSYLQNVDGVDNEFAEPAIPTAAEVPCRSDMGTLWLVHLVRGNLGQ